MLNEYIKDLMADMENEVDLNDTEEDKLFNEYLNGCNLNSEKVKDEILKVSWDCVECIRCFRVISIINCDFVDGMLPVCKNGCK